MPKWMRPLILWVSIASLIAGCGQASPQPSPTRVPLPTPVPSPTPVPTPVPSPTPIPGFKKFEGSSVELWMPDSFDGGELTGKDLEAIVAKVRSLGSGFESTATMIEQNPNAFLLWIFDSNVGDSGQLTTAVVTTEKIVSSLTLDTYLDAAIKQLPSQLKVTSRDIAPIGRYQAGRLLINFDQAKVKEIMYAIKANNAVYVIVYATGAGEFEKRLPIFEQSMQTFAIKN